MIDKSADFHVLMMLRGGRTFLIPPGQRVLIVTVNTVHSGRSAPRRLRREFQVALVALVVVALAGAYVIARAATRSDHHVAAGQAKAHVSKTSAAPRERKPQGSPLSPNWRGDGKTVTLAFGGDVHFEGSLGERLQEDPATALDGNIARLLAGSDLSMTNFESALVDSSCPDPQPKQFVFYAPPTALTAFKSAHVSLVTEANNHGEDCGRAGLAQSLAIARAAGYPVLGIGANAAQAYTPYETTINGQRIAVIAATEVIDTDLISTWTATSTQPGLASAYQEKELIAEVQRARRVSDTVIVYLHWGTEAQTCPNTIQEPLAKALVKAGADIIIGAHAHVQLGAGYLGTAFVDYGLGNLAFYDTTPPETYSGALRITVTGRHIDHYTWRPALIEDGLPIPQYGATAATAVKRWQGLRGCTDLSAVKTAALATEGTETSPFTGPVIQPLGDPPGGSPGTTNRAARITRDS
jgi:poly-gamma-glutamate capsule biosynthesis protein CapA/YwtB (metallophosphatase superfamily)